MASVVYNSFKNAIMGGGINLSADTVKVALVSAYTPDIDNDTTYADISGEIIGSTGYTTGGNTLTNLSLSQDNTDNEGVWDADDITWTAATITASAAVIYDTTYSNQLICFVDFGSSKSSSSSNFTIQWNSEGILNLN